MAVLQQEQTLLQRTDPSLLHFLLGIETCEAFPCKRS
jgi:hypothetical protein